MATQNIVQLAPATKISRKAKAVAPKTETRSMAKRFTRQAYAAAGLGIVTVVLIGVSLSHLATGFQIVTNCQCLEAWALAVSIDLLYIGLELGDMLAATEVIRRSVATYTGPATIATMAFSAVLNALAFAAHAEGTMVYAACVMGCIVPCLIFVGTKVTTKLWVACHSR